LSARIAIAALAAFGSSILGAALAQPSDVARYVARVENALRGLERSADRHTRCAAFVDEALDVAAIGRSVVVALGDRLPARLHASFEAAVRVRLARECVRLAEDQQGANIEIVATPGQGRVTTRSILASGATRIVRWRLVAGGPWGLRASEVSGDGRSLVGTLRDEAEAALGTTGGDAEAMIRVLRR
jgi:hypothetical protein